MRTSVENRVRATKTPESQRDSGVYVEMGGIETSAPIRAEKWARIAVCATTAPLLLAEYAAPAAGLRGGLLRYAGPLDRSGRC